MWGILNALYFLPLLLTNNNRNNLHIVAEGRTYPTLKELLSIILTFTLTVFAWIFFRADSIPHALDYISGIFSSSLLSIPHLEGARDACITGVLIVFFIVIEWKGRMHQYALANLELKWRKTIRYAMYYLLIFLIFWFGGKEQQFIYFQF